MPAHAKKSRFSLNFKIHANLFFGFVYTKISKDKMVTNEIEDGPKRPKSLVYYVAVIIVKKVKYILVKDFFEEINAKSFKYIIQFMKDDIKSIQQSPNVMLRGTPSTITKLK